MSFSIALSGINAINDQLEVISNNIANTGTTGYKSGRVNFGAEYAGTAPNGVRVGSVTQSLDVGGSQVSTGRALDVAIEGKGYLIARDSAGVTNYTRAGILDIDKDGLVVDAMGRKIQGYGVLPGTTALGSLGNLQVLSGRSPARASDTVNYVGNLSADWSAPSVGPFDRSNPLTFNSSVVSTVYDSLGTQHTVTQYFVKTGTNAFDVHYSFDGAAVPGATAMTFGTDGQLLTPAGSTALALPTPVGAAPLAVGINYAGTTQLAGDSSTTTNAANGYASGQMVSVSIEADGSVKAQYSNGQNQLVGTIALATFPSESGLVAVDNTSWIASNTSGTPLVSAPGIGLAGNLSSGSLEQSNVDVTEQLVQLMGAQRNYQANTKVITANNEMIQSLMQAI